MNSSGFYRLLVASFLIAATACDDKENFDIVLDIDDFDFSRSSFGGTAQWQGTVALPAEIQPGVALQLGLSQATSGPPSPSRCLAASVLQSAVMARRSSSVRYLIDNVRDQSYRFWLFVNVAGGNGQDAGDYGGYYAGTVDVPAKSAAESTAYSIPAGAENKQVNFGLGVQSTEDIANCSAITPPPSGLDAGVQDAADVQGGADVQTQDSGDGRSGNGIVL